MPLAAYANLAAMSLSLLAVIQLAVLVPKIGGDFGTMFKLTSAGIFFAVFVHSLVELLAVFEVIDERALLLAMGGLITLGSACFLAAAAVARRSVV